MNIYKHVKKHSRDKCWVHCPTPPMKSKNENAI